MSSPQPAAPTWFARLSPLRRLGAIFGTALVLSLVGAAGFIALLPGDGGQASLIVPAAAGTASPANGAQATADTAGVGPAPTAGAVPRPAPKPTTGVDPRFGTCQQARQHGYGPYRRDDTGYGWYPDADNDGVVCE